MGQNLSTGTYCNPFLPASLRLGAILAPVSLFTAVVTLEVTALGVLVDIGVGIGAAAAAPRVGRGRVVSPRIIVSHRAVYIWESEVVCTDFYRKMS